MYLSCGISVDIPYVCEKVCKFFLCIPSNFLAIILPIKSQVGSAFSWITLFDIVLSAYEGDYFASSKKLWMCLPFRLLLKLY